MFSWGFPGGSVVKNLPANAGDADSISGSGRSPGEGNGNPLQYSCQDNPVDRGAWWDTVYKVANSWTQLMTEHTHGKIDTLFTILTIFRALMFTILTILKFSGIEYIYGIIQLSPLSSSGTCLSLQTKPLFVKQSLPVSPSPSQPLISLSLWSCLF